MADDHGSITAWLGVFKGGDDDALRRLVKRYFAQPVERARAHLCAIRQTVTVSDAEDVALSAFQALWDGVRKGRLPDLHDRDDLWRVLLHLASCKVRDRRREAARAKRGGGKERPESHLVGDDEGLLEQVVGREPSPELVAEATEEYVRLLGLLADPTLRRIAELKLACHTNPEIAAAVGVSPRTIDKRFALIRKIW